MLSKTVSHSTSGSYFTQCTYANGQVICKFYDKYDRLIKLSEGVNGQVLAKFIYSDEAVADTVTDPTDTSLVISGSSKLRVVIDTTTNTRTTYHYDNLGVLTKVQNQNITITQLEKQADDDWDKKVEYSLGGDKITTAYKYVSEINNSLQSEDTQFNSLEKISTSYTKDNLQRLTATTVMHDNYGYKTTIAYAPRQTKKWVSDGFTPIIKPTAVDLDTDLPPITGHWEITDVGTTQYVSSFQEYSISGTTETLVRTDAIEYDANGNITKYGDVTYEYDNLNRLIRENNPTTGIDKTITWCYDVGGNILSRTEYEYTTGDLTDVTPTNTYTYTYGNSWKDQLTSYNGQSIIYDQAGNTTSYKGASLTWARGRNMATYHIEGDDQYFDMCYDASGKRVSKRLTYEDPAENEVTTYYIYNGNNLVCEKKDNGGTISYRRYLYNSQGVIGYVIGSTVYTYRKNLFGDIVAIYQGSTKVAEYAYDAWGNCTIVSDSWNIGASNPFRYRGYYWDEDLQLYYLMSRYYDPQVGRFISSTGVSRLNPRAINGFNLYAYAGGNPIYITTVDMRANSRIDSVSSQAPSNSIVSPPNSTGNYSNLFSIHWKNKWGATDWPSLFVFSNTKGALVDWGLSIYKGSLYFDEAENHSIYVGLGNVSAFIGYNVEEKKYGVFADINVLSAGYDGRYIDASISVVGVGFILGWEGKKFRFKIDPPGWFGFEISIDFGQIIKDIFGWEW